MITTGVAGIPLGGRVRKGIGKGVSDREVTYENVQAKKKTGKEMKFINDDDPFKELLD